jgi:hypothetical protein
MKRTSAITIKISLLLALIGIAFVSGCKKEDPEWKTRAYTKVDLSRSDPQALLPRTLWRRIVLLLKNAQLAAVGLPETEEVEKAADGSIVKHDPVPSVFVPLRVFLIERNRGILVKGDSEILFSGGGGEIDLADFVNDKNGSFYLAIEFAPEFENVKRHVFYLSGAKARRDQGETLGAGCNTYYNVTTAFEKAMEGKGILVNASGGRHTSALAGTFFFAAAHEGKLHLAALKIKDSAHRQYLCQQ